MNEPLDPNQTVDSLPRIADLVAAGELLVLRDLVRLECLVESSNLTSLIWLARIRS